MKLWLKIIILLLLALAILAGFAYTNISATASYITSSYFRLKGYDCQISDHQYKDHKILFSSVLLSKANWQIKMSELELGTDWLNSLSNLAINLDLKVGRAEVISNNDMKKSKLLEANLRINYYKKLFAGKSDFSITAGKIDQPQSDAVLQDVKKPLLPLESVKFAYHLLGKIKEFNLDAELGQNSFINLRGKAYEEGGIIAEANIANLSMALPVILKDIFPGHELLSFFDKFVKSGHIVNGQVSMNLDKPFLDFSTLNDKNLVANFKIKGLNLEYDQRFPLVKNMNVDLILVGSKAKFYINEAFSSRIKLYDGEAIVEWQGLDKTDLIITAKGQGPAADLTDFISETTHQKLKLSKIDLHQFTGQMTANVNIIIPLKPGSSNIYNISADIPYTSLNIFNDQVRLTKAAIKGEFDGKTIALAGKGKINGYNSELDFIYKINDNKYIPDDHHLKIRTYFRTNPEKRKEAKIGFVSFLGGNSFVDIDYRNKGSKGVIEVQSDLMDLELYFDKLGIRKQRNQKAQFSLVGEFEDVGNGKLELSLTGENNLNIKGDIFISGDKTIIALPQIKHQATDISANIEGKANLFSAKIKGKVLDLSDADMLQFMAKEREGGGSTKLEMDVDRVLLKNNIALSDLKLKFDCDKDRCYSGYIKSKIGARAVDVLLTAKGNTEEWVVNCTNAGALLKGIGAYKLMQAGKLNLLITTSRKEVSAGEIIPISNGNFTFERFVLQEAPILSRLVSLVSLPGFLSMLTNNKDLVFSKMTGNFSFTNNILSISKGFAEGPFFDFTINGRVDINNRQTNLYGHVKPDLYGISKIIKIVPIIGTIVTGDKKRPGLFTAPFKIEQKY